MSATDTPRRGGLATLVDWWRGAGVGRPAWRDANPAACDTPRPGEARSRHADRLFAQGLREDSNLEYDWLWPATMVTDEGQARYCLGRALSINPRSAEARREPARLDRRRGTPPVALWRRRG